MTRDGRMLTLGLLAGAVAGFVVDGLSMSVSAGIAVAAAIWAGVKLLGSRQDGSGPEPAASQAGQPPADQPGPHADVPRVFPFRRPPA